MVVGSKSDLVAGVSTIASDVVDVSLVAAEVCRIGEPLDSLDHPPAHAVDAAEFRAPAELLACPGIVGPEPFDLAVGGTQARLVGLDFDGCPHDIGDHLRGRADRYLKTAAEIDGLADDLLRRRRKARDQAARGVGDEREIARRADGTEADVPLAGRNLADDRRDHRACRLPRAKGVERADYHDGHAERSLE